MEEPKVGLWGCLEVNARGYPQFDGGRSLTIVSSCIQSPQMLPQPPRICSYGPFPCCCPRPWLLFSRGPPPLPTAMVVVQPWSPTAAPGHGCCSAMVPHRCPRPWLLFSHGPSLLLHPLPVICVEHALSVLVDWKVTPRIDMPSETSRHLPCLLELL